MRLYSWKCLVRSEMLCSRAGRSEEAKIFLRCGSQQQYIKCKLSWLIVPRGKHPVSLSCFADAEIGAAKQLCPSALGSDSHQLWVGYRPDMVDLTLRSSQNVEQHKLTMLWQEGLWRLIFELSQSARGRDAPSDVATSLHLPTVPSTTLCRFNWHIQIYWLM